MRKKTDTVNTVAENKESITEGHPTTTCCLS